MLYIRFGFGFGYMYNYFLPKVKEQGSEVFVYEPSYDIFNYFIRLFDISQFFSDYPIKLFINEHIGGVSDVFPHIIDASVVKTYAPSFRGYNVFFKNELEIFANEIVQFCHYRKSRVATTIYFNTMWLKHTLLNLKYIFNGTGTHGYSNLLDGKPAILVSAGPSLNKNVHLLKEIQGKVFIAAAYSAIKTLERHNIYPDIFFALDAEHVPYEVGNDYDISKINFMFHPGLSPIMFEYYKDNYSILLQNDLSAQNETTRLLLCEVEKQLELPSIIGGSIAHAITDILRLMGAGTIVLLGQDLAFTEGQHHAKEYLHGQNFVTEEQAQAQVDYSQIILEDINGDLVASSYAYESFIKQFEQFIRLYNDSIKVIDATEGGAKIKGSEIMTLREVIDTHLLEYTDPCFTKNIKIQAKEKGVIFNKEEQEKIILYLEKLLKQCEVLEDITDDVLSAMDDVLKLFRFNKIPTEKEMRKPVEKAIKFGQIISDNFLAISMANASWMATNQDQIAMKRPDEHQNHYLARRQTALLTQHRINSEFFTNLLKDAIEILKKERG
jgi:hypothetical protein